MSQDWMIDVLADIRQFARANRFPGLAEVLDDAIIVAAGELRERAIASDRGDGYDVQTGVFRRGVEELSGPR